LTVADPSHPTVELFWWEGCPSYPTALEQLEEALAAEGIDPQVVRMREVESDEQAAREHFPGSPTIRVDGEDVVPPGEGEPFSLTCRIYRLRDGRISPTPDPADVRAALRRGKEPR
jgi:hypothetical protein